MSNKNPFTGLPVQGTNAPATWGTPAPAPAMPQWPGGSPQSPTAAPTRPSQARMPAVAPPAAFPSFPESPPPSPSVGAVVPSFPASPPKAAPRAELPAAFAQGPPPSALIDPAVLNQLLSVGVQHGASDIHFRPGDPPTYRINGELKPLQSEPMLPAHTEGICRHLVTDETRRANLRELQEYDGSYSVPGSARFRVNIYRQRGSLSAILRIIPPVVPTIADLGLPAVVQTLALQERGLVLVTGATGSGKTSTLAAMIDHINRNEAVHILTIEDPIEFLHRNARASVSQREIGTDTRDFTGALRAALRQDPDVILVGEMRDTETIDIALKAAETGHLVLSTVHTTDAASTISRLVSVFPPEEQVMVRLRLSECLRGTISQRLLARADGQGRVAALEVMVHTKTVQEFIRDATRTSGIKDVLEKGGQSGMQSFDQHLTRLYKQGLISLDTAASAASNPADFQRALHFD